MISFYLPDLKFVHSEEYGFYRGVKSRYGSFLSRPCSRTMSHTSEILHHDRQEIKQPTGKLAFTIPFIACLRKYIMCNTVLTCKFWTLKPHATQHYSKMHCQLSPLFFKQWASAFNFLIHTILCFCFFNLFVCLLWNDYDCLKVHSPIFQTSIFCFIWRIITPKM